jgi:hypothetical protein
MNRHSLAERTARWKRREEIAQLVIEHVPLSDIAVRYGISVATVRYDIQKMKGVWLENIRDTQEVKQAEEVARFRALQIQYQRAYDRSCQPKEKTRVLKRNRVVKNPRYTEPSVPLGTLIPGVAPTPAIPEYIVLDDGGEEVIDYEPRDGDPRFLDGVAWCEQEIAKLKGAYPKSDAPSHSPPQLVIIGETVNMVGPPPIPQSATITTDVARLLPSNLTFDEPNGIAAPPPQAEEPPAAEAGPGDIPI